MTELSILIRAHDENERLRLGLTPEQIVRTLDRHQGRQGRPKVGRTRHVDPTGDTAAARADRGRR